ncbi:MAG: Amino acid/amide transporter substrate-binding protein family [Enterovirga sp.]|jgi:branched-chain amino acid transport system substrate-binding protein|nr:Amino acid/amide transporter substrate-binding protein family [Enterovirga sp.]
MHQFGRLCGAALLAGALGFGAAPAEAQAPGVTKDEITIGALGALTGATSFMGGPGRDGLQLGIEQINAAGGINGRKIKLVYEHAFTPAESVAAAKKLVESDKVFALILSSGSTGAAAAANYVRETGVPTYNLFGATPIIRTPFAKNVFHGAMPDAPTSAQALVDRVYQAKPDAKKIGLLVGTYSFPQSNKAAILPILEARGVKPVIEEFDQDSRDFTSQLISMARQRVDAVIVLGSFSEAGFAYKQAPEKGLANAVWVLDGSAVNDAIVPIIGERDPKNVWGYSNMPAFPAQDHPEAVKFRQAWIAKYGTPPQGRPNSYDMVGYGGAFILAKAIEAAGENLTWDGLIGAWSTMKGAKPSDLGGADVIFPETFSETDHQGNRALGRATIKGGLWQTVGQ